MALHSATNRRSQKGAALLALLMVFIVAASYSLVKKLNANSRDYLRQGSSLGILNEAKAALIGYAINYPLDHPGSGPGILPCPDTTNNGSAIGNCTGATTGRFPFKTIETEDLRDHSGERLWYRVADNYRSYTVNSPLVNSETVGNFSVDGNTDVVAVIFAPGPPVETQDRVGGPLNVANYLEDDNSDTGDIFVTRATLNPNNVFNDTVVTITRQELMSAVEKRVLGEIKTALSSYADPAAQGAYPWLASFADPKTVEKRLEGTHTGSDNQTNLTDSSTDFTEWNVAVNDVVWNVTDGSYGLVTAISANTLTIGSGLSLGAENDFDSEDEYYVDVSTYSTAFIGTAVATSGSSNLVLEDTTKDFDALGVQIGDIVGIVADGSSGVINDVTSTTLMVSSLSGATNAFSDGDAYRIRTSQGRVTAASATVLTDTNVDFTVMGIQTGDLVRNITDNSFGRVTIVTANSLTVDELKSGSNNTFSVGDYYVLPRYNVTTNIRKGLVSFHEPGEIFNTSFTVDWNIPEIISAANNATISLNTPGTHTDYINNVKQFVQTSIGTSGTITVDIDNGSCVWINIDIVECKGSSTVYDPVQGQMTSGSNTEYVNDNTKNFTTLGINEGDIVQNYDDETSVASGTSTAGTSGLTLVDSGATFTTYDPEGLYNYLVRNTDYSGSNKSQGILASIDDDTTLEIVDYNGWNVDPVSFSAGDDYEFYTPYESVVSEDVSSIATNSFRTNRLVSSRVDFDNQEFYRVKVATGKLTGTVDSVSGTTLTDTSQTFVDAGVAVGDVVHNITDSSWGKISARTNTTLTAVLYDSTNNATPVTTTFDVNDSYEVYYAYMNSRRYEFNVRFNGSNVVNPVNGIRKRDVCLGYTDCTGSASNVSLPFYNFSASSLATTGSSGLILQDTTNNFTQYGVLSSYVVFNTTDGSNGIISSVDSGIQFTVHELNDGADNDFDSGDNFYISVPVVTIKDFDASETQLSSATVTIPSGGAQGSINVRNIDMYLSESYDNIPSWFKKNGWHKLIYVAFSAGDAPAAAAACIAGTDCLTLNGAGSPSDNKQALVFAAGAAINTTKDNTCSDIASVTQDRTSGNINDYYELENCNADDTFEKSNELSTFNDQVRIIEP